MPTWVAIRDDIWHFLGVETISDRQDREAAVAARSEIHDAGLRAQLGHITKGQLIILNELKESTKMSKCEQVGSFIDNIYST